MAENIKLIVNQQQNFTVDQGYFYSFDNALDNLLVKTDDGNTAFSYPLDTVIGGVDVTSAEFDGVYFWSLENTPATSTIIKRWLIENYVCKLQQTYSYVSAEFQGGGVHTFDSEAFSVAHYHDTFEQTTGAGSPTILLTTYGDDSDLLGFTTTSGDGLTLHLGPNSSSQEEDVTVTGTITGGVGIDGTTTYAYETGDAIHFYTNIWMFNDYDGTDSSTGALYKFDAYTGDLVTKYPSGAYKDIGAATFYRVDSFGSEVDTLAYIKGTNILFVDVSDVNLPYYGSMVLENILTDEATVIPVVDLTMDDQNVYRLQRAPDGGSSLTQWSTYSYELSSLDSFVTSISLAAYPAIIAANTVSTSTITAIVKDQFLQPIGSRNVYFTASDPGVGTDGYIVTPIVGTDADGEASTTFRSGDTASEVTITAVVEQT